MKKVLLAGLSMVVGLAVTATSPNHLNLPKGMKKAQLPESLRNVTRPVVKPGPHMDNGIPVTNPVTRLNSQASPSAQAGKALRTAGVSEVVIGATVYDLQTNGTISNRLVKNDDGTVSASWTYAANTSFADRGTGYNYLDPTSAGLWVNGWLDPISGAGPGLSTITRAEGGFRTGFTNIAVCANGNEMSIAHSSTAGRILLNRRLTKGSGAWTQDTSSLANGANNNDTWAKAVADGNNVYAIWQGSGTTGTPYLGQDGPILFSRSQDGGATWNPIRSLISQIDSNNYSGFGGDSYSIDARNGVVAIAYAGAFKDVGLLKSTDGGNTWTKTVIQTGFMNFFNDATFTPDVDGDGNPDSVLSNGEDAHVLIDNSGNCHVWFSTMFYMNDDSTDGSWSYYPYTDGLNYWHEGLATDSFVEITGVIDANGNGFIDLPTSSTCASPALLVGNYAGGGLSIMPSAGIDANGTLYLTYQSLCEECDTNTFSGGTDVQGRRHVYIMTSSDGGNTWTFPVDIVPTTAEGGNGEYQEAVYACVAKKVGTEVYVLYQRDTEPGTSLLSSGCDQVNNSSAGASNIVFARIPVDVANGTSVPSRNDFQVSQNYPNPANGTTNIDVTLSRAETVNFSVTDMLGKTVYSNTYRNFMSGKNTIVLNASDFAPGVYNYSVVTNDQKVTKQLIVR